jgi:hypothetical protein
VKKSPSSLLSRTKSPAGNARQLLEKCGITKVGVGFGLIHFPFSSHAPVPTRKMRLGFDLRAPSTRRQQQTILLRKIFLDKELDICPIISYL